jgi:hypothetical protein
LATALVFLLIVGMVVPKLQFTMLVLTALAVACHILLLVAARRIAGRALSVVFFVSMLWMAYFPVRLLVIQGDRHNFTLHPLVARATDVDLLWAWSVSALGLASLLVGSWFVKSGKQRIVLDLPTASRSTYAVIAAGGFALQVSQSLFGIESGLLAQAQLISLFGLAGLGFLDSRSGRVRLQTVALVAVGVFLGSTQSFKELAVLPVAAWTIGLIAGSGSRVRARYLLAGFLVALVAFLGVQGQRIAANGGSPVGLLTGAERALKDYDLRTGYPQVHRKRGAELFTNVAYGVSGRFYGADLLLVLRDQVPDPMPFQRGRTIIDPALSVVPGVTRFVDLTYPELSLGRYVTVNLYSVQPNSDPSSQILTWPGDLYLNFGLPGIVGGLLAIGALLGLFDRLATPTSPFGCALLAFVGTALVRLESGVAFAMVTALMRLAIVLAVVLAVGRVVSSTGEIPACKGSRRHVLRGTAPRV